MMMDLLIISLNLVAELAILERSRSPRSAERVPTDVTTLVADPSLEPTVDPPYRERHGTAVPTVRRFIEWSACDPFQ